MFEIVMGIDDLRIQLVKYCIKITPEARLIQLAKIDQIPGVFMIYMGMSGNGFRTGGIITTKALLLMVVLGKV